MTRTGQAAPPSYVELGVPDTDTARTFYGAVLGWRFSGEAGNGQAETGQHDASGLSIGLHGDDPSSLLEVFFAVDDLDRAAARVTAAGGKLLTSPRESAGFGRHVECEDDQGVRFGLHQPE